ncbi:glycosyltransferase family 2 protein [Desulfotalea psychrophila]|uniref:Related to glycosyl transferase n=1 Tax=Desulfotalea psychrophila (strain LSv54 / DSM 12343) TaxID=177439 RepID=Q6AK17_DESPS|nr:glycosyltransferase family A protein [Desulfotalea psychrophila]CAG37309.1 related to glycosyl transferase [Desulfotalea psychrophila LSv54]
MNFAPISVVIPTYNRDQYLVRAIDSVLRQSLRVAEIVIVDDGSTDGSEALIRQKKAEQGVPIRYIYQKNQGPAAARNNGLQHASSDYIAYLDSDDHWHKKKIEKQYGALCAQPEMRISHTYEKWLRRGEHLNQKKKHIPGHGDIFAHCLQLCAVGMSTVMLHRSIFSEVGLFDEGMRCCEDYDFWLRVSCRYPFLLVDERLTIKEGGRDDQVSYQYRVGMDRLRIDALERLLLSARLNPAQELLARRELVRKAHIFGEGAVRHGQEEIGLHYLQLADKYQLQEKN